MIDSDRCVTSWISQKDYNMEMKEVSSTKQTLTDLSQRASRYFGLLKLSLSCLWCFLTEETSTVDEFVPVNELSMSAAILGDNL